MEWLSDNWQIVVQIAAWLVTIGGGGAALVPLIDWLKDRLGWTGTKAKALAVTAVVLYSIATLIASGELVPGPVNPEMIAGIAALVWTVSQGVYKKYFQEGDTYIFTTGTSATTAGWTADWRELEGQSGEGSE